MLTPETRSAIAELHANMRAAAMSADARHITELRELIREFINEFGDDARGVIVLEGLAIMRELMETKHG